jgi:hypothetical protein
MNGATIYHAVKMPKISMGILHANRKCRITFDRKKIAKNFQKRRILNRGQGIKQ